MDDAEWELLVGGQLAALTRLALLLLADRTECEDVVAEALARSYPRLRRGGVDDPLAYLRRAVVNTARSRRRRRRLERRWAHVASGDHRGELALDDAVADRSTVLAALRTLPSRQRAAVVLRYYEDLTLAETAELLGVSVGTVKAQVSRGLTRLRTELTEERSRP